MAQLPKNIRVSQLMDARKTLVDIYQRNKNGMSNPRQSLNDLYTVEYICKKMGLKSAGRVTQIRKATSDFLSGRLSDKSYASLLRYHGKHTGINVPSLQRENLMELNQVFSSGNNSNSRKPITSMKSIFGSSSQKMRRSYQSKRRIGLNSIFSRRRVNERKGSVQLKKIFGGK